MRSQLTNGSFMIFLLSTSRSRKVIRWLDESSNAFFHPEAKDNYGQLCHKVLHFVIFGLSNCFEPDATAVHLANIENVVTDQCKVLTILLALTKMKLIGRN